MLFQRVIGVSVRFVVTLWVIIQACNGGMALKCGEDDEDCREQFMHPDLREHALKRRSIPAEVLSDYWLDKGQRFVAYKDATANTPPRGKAKNIILFLGDGMSLSTLAATRIYLGGEEQELSFESFPDTGLMKTYAIDSMVPDSACAATAFLAGVKANYGTLGVSGHVERGDCDASANTSFQVDSIGKWALDSGRQVGLITNTRITHATPAGLYAHVADRDWENDKKLKNDCGKNSGIKDIALQLMEGDVGSRLKVIMGGGRAQFVDNGYYEDGKRRDGRNLIQEFLDESAQNIYVETKEDLEHADVENTKRLLGLFNDGHMKYNLKAMDSVKNHQPSLPEMTKKAIEILQNDDKGYFLLVEGGRIDTAHHDNKAKLALDETAQLSEAVALARSMTSEEDTLIVVAADHSHTMSISGYAKRSNNIFGIANLADDNIPYLTLSYANGPSFKDFFDTKNSMRYDPSDQIEDSDLDFDLQFPSTAPLESETHGGEDVAVYASGPWSDLFSGVYEQSTLPYLMAFAGCFGPGNHACQA
ncbi:membrane-bound alkaline phosphatase [Stomoxys calcitrans]|uniref:Alkaline phosphatase n=1 Tax=Stomoxys calcitrans TaxID=35570 RepID=A0A1I8PPM1_STOCA|nr:membrane-bound alkaline phosphatase [Stomoxys calcitrans]